MNVATIPPISIQLKPIRDYNPIFLPSATKYESEIKSFVSHLENVNY